MKKISVLIIFICLTAGICFSQHRPDRQDKIYAAKVAFFTERLQLTPQEAEKFWPVYNDYQNRRDKIIQDRKNTTEYYIKNADNLSDKEIDQILNDYISYQKKETALLENFNSQLKTILPERKVIKVYITEIQFRNYLLGQLRDNR